MRKKYTFYLFITFFITLNLVIIFNSIKLKNNQDNYFRLHVVASSNSLDDQIIKLNVTKSVNNYLNKLYELNKDKIKNVNDKEEAKKLIENNINSILEVANNEIALQNGTYTSYAKIGKISYGEKYSDKINMEEGIYDSVQIVLGEGNGENFWSLIFPYSYNSEFNTEDNKDIIENKDIKIKSGIIESIKKVIKQFS